MSLPEAALAEEWQQREEAERMWEEEQRAANRRFVEVKAKAEAAFAGPAEDPTLTSSMAPTVNPTSGEAEMLQGPSQLTREAKKVFRVRDCALRQQQGRATEKSDKASIGESIGQQRPIMTHSLRNVCVGCMHGDRVL